MSLVLLCTCACTRGWGAFEVWYGSDVLCIVVRCEWLCFILGYRQRAFENRHPHISHKDVGLFSSLHPFAVLSLPWAVHGFVVAPLVASFAATATQLARVGTARGRTQAIST
jgi:hypothetical protein